MDEQLLEKPGEGKHKERRMKKSPSDNRVHIAFPDGMRARLEEIKDETDAGTMSELFRNALKFYMLAYEEHKKESDLLIRNKNGEVERLRMFI